MLSTNYAHLLNPLFTFMLIQLDAICWQLFVTQSTVVVASTELCPCLLLLVSSSIALPFAAGKSILQKAF